jgi:hypothetical protein
MTAVADTAVDLHGPIGCLAHQTIGAVVGHGHFVGHLDVVVAV